MRFFEGIKSFARGKTYFPGFYLCKRPKDVPPGSVIVFPTLENRLNCGLTGILAFKGKKKETDKTSLEGIDSAISKIEEYTLKNIIKEDKDPGKDYLGGDSVLRELQDIIWNLKTQSSLYRIFRESPIRESLDRASLKLGEIIKGEEANIRASLNIPSIEARENIVNRMTLLKDIKWSLANEILGNTIKIEGLSCLKGEYLSSQAFEKLMNVNILFNNLDRLEVRGRDSAGISTFLVLKNKDFASFEGEMKKRSLLDEYSDRQVDMLLSNRQIAIKRNNQNTSLAFTYKVAAQIGRLGDNVKFLREQVRNDKIFQHLITYPTVFQTAMAHTRWASVGEISEPNCHPVNNHLDKDSARSNKKGTIHVYLNGDIDNYFSLKENFEIGTGQIIPLNITTDTKIIPLQIQRYYESGQSIEDSFRMAVNDFKGSHAIAMHTDLAPGKIFLAQRGSGQAIFVGLGKEQYITASEIYGLVEQTSRYIKIEGQEQAEGPQGKSQGQIFLLDQETAGGLSGIKATYYDGTPLQLSDKDIKITNITSRDIDRQDFPHYFLKEIFESPKSVEATIQNRWRAVDKQGRKYPEIILDGDAITPRLEKAFNEGRIRRILFIGQGTAGVAAHGCSELLGHYLQGSGIRVAPLKSSEFSGGLLRTKLKDTLIVAITQSGTTTDTNMAIDMAKERGAYTMAIVNRRDSDITFKVNGVLYTSSGRDIEMSVASTKAYYSQIAAGAILGLKLAQLAETRSNDFILGELKRLIKVPYLMKKVLAREEEIAGSAKRFAPEKKYWAVVGSGYNKIAADEIRIKLSELCYKTISSDVVEDKKHIDLSSEPLIFICAAGSRNEVTTDIIKDTAIFKAHQATTIVVTDEGEERFGPYADSVIHVPEVGEHFSPILTTLAGHLWGYHAAKAIDEESGFLYNFRKDITEYISESIEKGMDVYQIVLDRVFQEKAARFSREFKKRLANGRYATAMQLSAAADLTLLMKYLSGRLPMSDFELDFGVSGTAPNMFDIFLDRMGKAINDMARPIDAIKHQAKTVTVGTSRLWEPIEGILFDNIHKNGFSISNLTNKNVLVLRNLQDVVSEIKGETLYQVSGLNYAGEPVEDSRIELLKKEGSASALKSRVETDNRLKGTKRIIVEAGNVFIGRGKADGRSILVIPLMKNGPNVDHLLLLNVALKQDIDLPIKAKALGEKLTHIKNFVEETGLAWKDEYLNLLDVEELFGNSAEKIAESIISHSNRPK